MEVTVRNPFKKTRNEKMVEKIRLKLGRLSGYASILICRCVLRSLHKMQSEQKMECNSLAAIILTSTPSWEENTDAPSKR